MNLAFLNQTIGKVVKYAKTLPDGIGLLTTEDGLPLSPIQGMDGKVSHWVIYLEKRGSGPRPRLTSQAMNPEGIADLGAGWKVARLRVDHAQIQFGNTVVDLLRDLTHKLTERDRATEN